tara:strand:+ start:673 stop:2553 length:1881 start_codon:yes stop_codon:yes gene_type:complete
MLILINIIGLLGAIKVSYSSTSRNSEPIFLKGYLFKLLKYFGVTSNDTLIFVEGENIVFSAKNNSGIETVNLDEINTKIKVNKYEKFAYIAITFSNLLKQLVLQKYFYCYLYIISILSGNLSTKYYLKRSISLCNSQIKKIRNLYLAEHKLNNKLKFDSWFLQNIQYSFNNSSVEKELAFKNLFILKASLGINKNYSFKGNTCKEVLNSNFDDISKPIKDKVPKKVLIFYIDNISFFLANNKYSEEKKYPYFANLLKNHKLKNFKFSSTTDWTFPAAISLFSGKKYTDHMVFHRAHRPYYSINNLIRNFADNQNEDIYELKKLYQARFVCGTNWRMHQHHGLANVFNHLMTNPKFTDVYDVVSQAYKQIDIAQGQNSLHWFNFMDSHHPVKDSVLPFGALKYLNINSIRHGLQYETGPKFNDNISNKELPKEIYYSQIESVAQAIDNILNYSYQSCSSDEHLILFLSDHGSSFCPRKDFYSNILEKHSPLLSISSNYLSSEFIEYAYKSRFSHFGFFKLVRNIIKLNLKNIPKDCFSNYSQIIFPGKPYEFFYFDDDNKLIYQFVSLYSLPKKIVNFSNKNIRNKYKDIFYIGRWYLIKLDKKDNIEFQRIPEYIQKLFNSVLPFS